MALPILAVLAAVAAALAGGAAVQRGRFARRVHREARDLWGEPAETPGPLADLDALPAPVRRYLEASGAAHHPPVRRVRLRHGGTFRPTLEKGWLAIRGEQYLSADPPGFVWWGRVRAAPGIWIDARDRSRRGAGNMWIVPFSTFTLADARGPELDASALLRLLGELVWIPTVIRDARYVAWTALDDRTARARLTVGGRAVEATFRFGPDGLVEGFEAERYRDVGGRPVLTPFSGTCAEYREVGGLRVPFRLEARWQVAGEVQPYARFLVERLELDPAEPW